MWALYCQEMVIRFQQGRTFPPKESKAKAPLVCLQWWRFFPGHKNTPHKSHPASLIIMLRFRSMEHSRSLQKSIKMYSASIRGYPEYWDSSRSYTSQNKRCDRDDLPPFSLAHLWAEFTPEPPPRPRAPSSTRFTSSLTSLSDSVASGQCTATTFTTENTLQERTSFGHFPFQRWLWINKSLRLHSLLQPATPDSTGWEARKKPR